MTGQHLITNPLARLLLLIFGLLFAVSGFDLLWFDLMLNNAIFAVLGIILFSWGAAMLMLLWLKQSIPESEKETTPK